MSKICKKKDCSFNGEEQPTENFYKDCTKKDGIMYWCKTCVKESHKNSKSKPKVIKRVCEPGTKICPVKNCVFNGVPQLLDCFYNDNSTNDGKTHRCRTCMNKDYKERMERKKPIPLFLPEGTKRCTKIDCSFNNDPQQLENFSIVNRNYSGLSTWCITCQKKYRDSKKFEISERRKAAYDYRYETDIQYRMRIIISGAIRHSLIKCNGKEGHSWEQLVDFNVTILKEHLESLFQEGMSWENYGEWHIDHIRPVSSFNITSYDCEDFKRCWSLENLQPLWAEDNLRKGNIISEEWNNV